MAQNILVIDDDAVTLSLLSLLLKSAKYDVSEATNGKAGLLAILESDIDLVLCDIEMPEMDGFSVLQKAREADFQKPFIFLSGRDTREDLRAGMDLGADDYLTKPVVPAELYRCVESRLSSTSYQLAQNAQDLNSFKSFLSTVLPHEFRTPLGLISGYADILSTHELDYEDQADVGRMIKGAANRLSKITENYLLLSLSEASSYVAVDGKQEEISGRIDQTIQDLSRSIAEKFERQDDLKIEVEDARINCSHRALEKIVSELVDNALKFSSYGEKVQVSSRTMGDSYQIVISDEGRGMTSRQIESMSAFTQHDRGQYEQQGLGLGIEVVKSLVNLANGTIDFLALKKGLEVKVQLPLNSD